VFRSIKNKRTILFLLVPVKLLQGKRPSLQLLQKYSLDGVFGGLVQACAEGNLRQFNDCVQANTPTYVRRGIYMLILRIRKLVHRNLIRKCCYIHGHHHIELALFEQAFLAMAVQAGHEEVEDVVAKLIVEGYIKGYISHKAKKLVGKNGGIGAMFPKIKHVQG
jgi:hypothetical protein